MEDMTFLSIVLPYLGILSVALLVMFFSKHGRPLAYFLNIIATVFFIYMVMLKSEFTLTESFLISGNKIKLITIFGVFNVLITILNGVDSVKNSILSSFMFIGAVFLLGAQNFILFYVAYKMISLLFCAFVNLSQLEHSKEFSIKYYIQDALVSVVLLLAIVLFFGSTGSFGLVNFAIKNQSLFLISLALFFVVTCFKMGVFPFHGWMIGVYSNMTGGNLAAALLFLKATFAYVFVNLLQSFIFKINFELQGILIYGVLSVAVISVIYGSLISLAQKDYKKIIIHSLLVHSGFIIAMACFPLLVRYEKHLVFFLVFYPVSVTGAILLINDYKRQSKESDTYKALKGGFYRNKLGALGLSICIFSLAGVPFTAGFTMRFLLFSDYFIEGYLVAPIIMILSAIIGLSYYIKYVVALFVRVEEPSTEAVSLDFNISTKVVQVFLILLVIVGGMAPSLFLD